MKQRIIRFLAKHGYQKEILQAAYEMQSVNHFEKMQFAFFDSLGRRYYRYKKMEDIPLQIMEKLTEMQEELACKIPGRDLDIWLDKCESVLNSDSKTRITEMGHLFELLKNRRKVLLQPNVLMGIAALLTIREDEKPGVYNEEIHKEKFELFTKECKQSGVLRDFFQAAGLGSYLPSGSITDQDWTQLLAQSQRTIEEFTSAVTQISTSRQKLADLANSSTAT